MPNASLSLFSKGLTDIGYVREKNEDAWGILPEHRFFIIADGMGGLPFGEVASSRCVSYLSELMIEIDQEIKGTKPPISEVLALVGAAVDRVNSAIFQKGIQEANGAMGTTLCCLYFLEDSVVYAHAGDSRIYLFRSPQEKPPKFIQLTEDHSLVNEKITHGEMTKQEASLSPYKNILTKAIGIYPHIEASISWMPVKAGDLFLLCTDGLTNYVQRDEIEEIMIKISLNLLASPEKALERGLTEMISLAKSHGGGDNITAVLVAVS